MFKPVPEFEGLYEVSNDGQVRSLDRTVPCSNSVSGVRHTKGRNKKLTDDGRGYLITRLSKDGKSRNFFVHRLVAMAFVPNPEGFKIINHIDGNPKNSTVDNIEWCTQQHNVQHGYDEGLNLNKYPVVRLSMAGEFLGSYDSLIEAVRNLGKTNGSGDICMCCKGTNNRVSAYGYRWMYEEDYNKLIKNKIMEKKFVPNLIPNSPTGKPIDIPAILKKLGRSVSDYIVSMKKDGCRVEIIDGEIKTRALKQVSSTWIQKRYAKLAQVCKENDVILEGEFYAHGMKFNEICRFFKTSDVTDKKHTSKLHADKYRYNIRGTKKKPIWEKYIDELDRQGVEMAGYVSKFDQDWPGRSVEWMSTYHDDLKIWPFDCYLKNYPELEYDKRMEWLIAHIVNPNGIFYEFNDILEVGTFSGVNFPDIQTYKDVEELYNSGLHLGWEGLVLAYKKRTYKFGRCTANEADLFKLKEDKLEFDGEVIDIIEGTVAKEGAEKTINELGRSVTSKLAEDRIPSGVASGILSEYEGHQIKVSFEGYSHEELKEILRNKEEYIGRWFKYTGMKPVKNVPRHAHMTRNSWRDGK